MIVVTESEAAVLELRLTGGQDLTSEAGRLVAPAWAAHLAAAEVYDWWRPGALRQLPDWPRVWELAWVDSTWATTTNQLVEAAADPRDAFFASWVDAWLARTVGQRIYPAELRGVLRAVRSRRGPW